MRSRGLTIASLLLDSKARIWARSADPRSWGPRFFCRENPKSQKQGYALGFGSVRLRKNRRPQRRRPALRLPVTSGILTALCRQPALAAGMGARAQASRKRGARLLDGDG